MNRYRRSAQKSGPEATLMNVDDSIYFMCDENEETLTRPNIISRKTNNNQAQKCVPVESNRGKQQQQNDQGNPQTVNEPVQPVKNETEPVGNGQCVYYHLQDGSLAVVDLSSLVADENACGAQVTGVNQESQLSCSLPRKSDVGMLLSGEDRSAKILSSNSGIQETDLAIQSESSNGQLQETSKQLLITERCKESVLDLEGLNTQLNDAKDSSGRTLENQTTELEAQVSIPVSAQGSGFQEIQEQKECSIENDQLDQFVLLMVGNKTAYVSADMYQQFCIAQQNGDIESSVNFLSQVEQALGVPTGDLVSQYGSVATTPQPASPDEHSKAPTANMEPQQCAADQGSASNPYHQASRELESETDSEPTMKKDSNNENSDNHDAEKPVELQTKAVDENIPDKLSSKKSTSSPLKRENLNSNINIFKCGTCAMLFSTKELCLEHIYEAHKVPDSTKKRDEEESKAQNPVCHLCSENFSNKEELECHITVSHATESSNKPIGASPNAVTRESTSSESTNSPIPAEKSESKSNRVEESQNSSQLNYPKSFDCPKCSKTLASLYYFLIHGLLHENLSSEWICQICSEKFSLKQELVEHFRAHCEEDGKMATLETHKLESSVASNHTVSRIRCISPNLKKEAANLPAAETDPSEPNIRYRRSRRKSPVRAAMTCAEDIVTSASTQRDMVRSGFKEVAPPKSRASRTRRSKGSLLSPCEENSCSSSLRRSSRSSNRLSLKTVKNCTPIDQKSSTVHESSGANEEEASVHPEDLQPKRTRRRQAKETATVETKDKGSSDHLRSSRLINTTRTPKVIDATEGVQESSSGERTVRRSIRTSHRKKVVEETNITDNKTTQRPSTKESYGLGKSDPPKAGRKRKAKEDNPTPATTNEEVHPNDKPSTVATGRRSSKRKLAETAEVKEIVETKPEPAPPVKQTKRGRKSSTTTREILPEDGPQFESAATVTRKSRTKSSAMPASNLSTPNDLIRVQQSFVDIFNKVKNAPNETASKK